MRLRVDPGVGPPLLVPLGRTCCVRLAEAVIAAATLDDALGRARDSSRQAEAALASAIVSGGARPFLARFPAFRGADAAEGSFPDAAIALWLWSRERGRTAEVREPFGIAEGAGSLGGDFVAADAPAGTLDVSAGAWREWLAADGGTLGDLAAVTGARWERLERGDRPAGGDAGSEVATPEGRMLVAAVQLADAHRAASARFAERLAAARLEAIRELAYGAGHEINNPLANIATRAQTLLVDERDPERRRRLSVIVDQAFRARDLIGGLMLFARPPRPRPARVDPDGLVASVVEGVAAQAAALRVRIDHRPSVVPLAAWIDSAMVGEALRAVVANGLEAVTEGGVIGIEVSGPLPPARGGGDARRRCCVVVTDDGRGMDAATVRRAFDPFFSGREAGRGAGLGLSKARRFVEANDGSLTLESRPGAWTRVTCTLPLAPD